ncbi:MAG: hypothetical protein Ct9H300mP3_08960 [Gammaproteobacteria bacterium]|nr:MAG: hypothetical protein Ct9H300mP3_08960 [Gammaproteobacteria bacterium]
MVSTPHPGEAASCLIKKYLKSKRTDLNRELGWKRNLGLSVSLKVWFFWVFYKKGVTGKKVYGCGNAGMAKGGMGDVLAGLIGSFISQGLSLVEASETAVDLHSKAADIGSLELV